MTNTLSLYELNSLVRQAIETELAREYWVEAELSEVRESRGHCYMELVQKDDFSATPVARASAKCWRTSWAMIQPHFERVTGQRLHAGMKLRLKVYAQFHEAFGFSWIVSDIDPNFTLGDLARRRQEIIRLLKEEGVFDMQRELRLPLFCQRVAVISSETAAGYGDFSRQLADNDFGFSFHAELFPAIMQGEQVETSVISALNRIYQRLDDFDCVVIIRGGGATADMSGFDTLALAENVAQFPLPIITGIGHDRDESILDMVSHTRVKTPTAAAAFLVAHLEQVSDRIAQAEERITTLFTLVRTRQEALLAQLQQQAASATQQRLEQERSRCTMLDVKLAASVDRHVLNSRHILDLLAQRAASLDPQLMLKRGYSITLLGGKAVRQASMLKEGDLIETRLEQGTIKSVVTS